ncbi:hypothetical protein [Moorena producens]|uniref:hypothetical protein n=1 Tax=Moorena producens TaxID=1155739 RepID=UPI003C76B579
MDIPKPILLGNQFKADQLGDQFLVVELPQPKRMGIPRHNLTAVNSMGVTFPRSEGSRVRSIPSFFYINAIEGKIHPHLKKDGVFFFRQTPFFDKKSTKLKIPSMGEL